MNYLLKPWHIPADWYSSLNELKIIQQQIWPGLNIEIKQLLEPTEILLMKQPLREYRDLICVPKINKTAIC